MLRYTIKPALLAGVFLGLSLGLSLQAVAQFSGDAKYGFRVGLDLSRIPMHYLNPYRTDLEIQTDVRIDSDLYVALDGGWNRTRLDNKPVFQYNSQGVFLKAGVDYNLMKRKFPAEANLLYVGFRYGVARMQRQIPAYQVSDPYWGSVEGHFSQKTLLPQWAELLVGIKAEVLNNLFVGWSLHTRILITQNLDPQVRPYLIPGFGKATTNAVFDMSYQVSYRIPLWSPRPKKKTPKQAPQNSEESSAQ
jgi:hypothetical protein